MIGKLARKKEWIYDTVGIAATELHKCNTLTQDAPQSPPPRVWKAGMHLNVILSSTAEILSKRSPRFSGHNLPRTRRNAYLAIELWSRLIWNNGGKMRNLCVGIIYLNYLKEEGRDIRAMNIIKKKCIKFSKHWKY